MDRSVDTVSNLERGVSLPSHPTLERVSRTLNIPVSELAGVADDNSSERIAPTLFRLYEVAKRLDEDDLRLAYNIIRLIASRSR